MSAAAPGTLPALVDLELTAVLGQLGWKPGEVTVLSPASPRKFWRYTLRVDLDGGAVVKVRHLESAEAAGRLVRIRESLDRSFSAVLGWEGQTLVEEWIEGVPLDKLPADENHLDEAATLLGRLHRKPADLPADLPEAAPLDQAVGDLEKCRAAGLIPGDDVDRLADLLRRFDPGRTEQTLTHRDFCAENIIVDSSGALRVVDNEWIAYGPPGFELGRTRSRWRMSPDGWARFVAAYGAVRPIDDDALTFWSIAGAAWSIRLRIGCDPTTIEVPLGLLRTLLEESR